jgi:hypothetical protein
VLSRPSADSFAVSRRQKNILDESTTPLDEVVWTATFGWDSHGDQRAVEEEAVIRERERERERETERVRETNVEAVYRGAASVYRRLMLIWSKSD